MPRGRPRKAAAVPPSSSQPSEIRAPSPAPAPAAQSANPEVFRGVYVPTATASRSRRSARPSLSTNPSNLPSPMSSENLEEYETPGTSAVPTPNNGRPSRKRSRATRESSDAALALALQERIYQGRDILEVDNSDDLADEPIQVSDSDDEDVPLAKRRRPDSKSTQTKASRKPASSSRGSARAARQKIIDLDGVNDSETEDIIQSVSDDDDGSLAFYKGSSVELSDDAEEEDENVDEDEAATTGPRSWGGRRSRMRRGWGLSRKERQRRRLEASHPEIKTMWDNLKKVPTIPKEQAPQPESISRQLKSFQLEGLNWMMKQEKSQWKGGLLGDEMGMGKTIQAVSLMMSDYPQKQPSLVVVPPVALMQWSNEIGEYTNNKLKILIYHGTNSKAKKLSVSDLKKFDVIMISYSGLESIFRKETKGWSRGEKIVKEDSPIHAIHFHRLILDEAHSIKQRTTGVAKACFALKSTYKWCLSGTPVQNRIGEFFSLLRFLEVQPFANYYCKSCPCSSLHWAVDDKYKCITCGHRQLEHVSVFNQEILNPIISPDNEDDDESRKQAFAKLRLLTERIMLRRMKRDHTSSMELPPKEVIIHNEFFGSIEKDFANSIMGASTREFDTYVSRGVMLDNYANIFGLIMQMRQVADHPDLITKKRAEGGQNVLICNICDEPAEEAIRSKCKHDFCRMCVKDFIKTCDSGADTAGCPRCHIPLSIDLEQPEIEQDEDNVKSNSIINRIKMENWTSSTKIEMLVYDLWKLRSKKQTTKSIVFSQFTSMLQLVEWRLRRAGFNTVMLDGSMSPAQRQKSIDYFMTNANVEVFLVSLKAGGVALNLTEASRVFIIDPWWNPAAEWQSADRCHRIGQRRACVIQRLVVEDSIESRIVQLQEKKSMMIRGTLNDDDTAMEKLTPQDMQFLFRGS